MRIALSSVLLCSFACGGTAKSVREPTQLSVEESSLPYHIVQAKTGRELSQEAFYAELATKKAICVGESHTDAYHHWAQLTVVSNLARQGRAFATGMEMFQRPFQGVLDDFAAGKISEEVMLDRSDWKRRWSYSWSFYASIVRLTLERGGSIVALNISKELKEKWKAGSDGLSAEDRAKIPEMELGDQEHQRWFRALMESMTTAEGHGAGDHADHAWLGEPEEPEGIPEELEAPGDSAADPAGAPVASEPVTGPEEDFIAKIYPVQVLWDETMAESAYRWLEAGKDRQMVILAGHGHCHDSAIVRRIQRRGLSEVVSVRPVVETGHGEVADLLSAPENDYLFVMDKPAKK